MRIVAIAVAIAYFLARHCSTLLGEASWHVEEATCNLSATSRRTRVSSAL